MKLYFDTRGGKFAYITIYCDDELFGHILIPSFKIYMVEIPDGVKTLKISSTAKKFKFEGLRYDEIQDLELCFEKEPISFCDFGLRQWQYPYESIISLDGNNRDLLIYQISFPQNELEDALGYRARVMFDGKQLPTTYVKRQKRFYATEIRWAIVLVILGLFTFSLASLPELIKIFLFSNEGFIAERNNAYNMLVNIIIVIFSPACLAQILKYRGILKETQLKSEYYLDSDGNWSSSEK